MGQTDSKIGNGSGVAQVVFSLNDQFVEISDKFLVTFPLELKQLRELKSISLTRNRIHSLDGISSIVKLEEVDLSYNSLVRLQDELFKCIQLIKLNLSFNQINQLPPLIGNLRLLQLLNLSNNSINLIPSDIGQLGNLTILNLSFNQLQALPKEIGKMNSLNKLILNNNKIQNIPNEIGGLVQLQLLDLAENELRTLPTQISSLKSLVKLYLDNNDFLEMISEIGDLVQLKELNLRSNQLVDLPSAMHKLVNLNILDLDDNQWEGVEYTVNDIKRLLNHLKYKKDVVNKSRKSTSKEYRRTIQRQKLEDKKRLSVTSVFDTPFQIVEYKKKLYQIKGNKNVKVRRVDTNSSSLNSGDVFLLDSGKKIFVLVGEKSNPRERLKGIHFANIIRNENGGQSDIVPIDLAKSKKEDINEFWKEIPGGKVSLKPSLQQDDEEDDLILEKLFIFYDVDNRLEIKVHCFEPFYRSMLESNSCAVLDTGNDIYVWSGLYCSSNEKTWSMLKAEELLSHKNEFAELNWFVEDAESSYFKEFFVDWVDNSWDPNYKSQADLEEQARLNAEQERLRMEKEEAEELLRSNRRSYEISPNTSYNNVLQFSSANSTPSSGSISSNITPITSAVQSPVVTLPNIKPIPSPPTTHKPPIYQTNNNNNPVILPSIVPNLPNYNSSVLNNNAINTSNNQLSPTNSALSERERIKEREKEKIREKLKQREASSGNIKLPSLPNSTTVTPNISTPQQISQPTTPSLPTLPKYQPELHVKPIPQPVVEVKKQPEPVVSLPSIKPSAPTTTVQTSPTLPKYKPELPVKPTPTPTPQPVIEVKKQPELPVKPTPTPTPQPVVEIKKQPEPVKQPVIEVKQPVVEVKQQQPPITTTSTTDISELDNDENHLLTPLPDKVEIAKRKPATKNPIRARQEKAALEEEAAKKRLAEKELAQGSNNNASSGSGSSKSNTAAALGGFGLLYSLGANDQMFKKRAEKREQTTGDPFTINLQPKDQPKLLHIKGRRSPFVRQVELSASSLNKGDVFILDCGKEKNLVYQWNGSEANRIEKGKGMDVAKSIKDKERVGCRVVIVDEGKEPDDFWKIIGSRVEDIAPASSAGDDREAELSIRQYINLYRSIPINGDKELDLVPIQGRLSKTLLEPEECYILDCVSEMFVWTGTSSKLKVRNMTLKLANDMFAQRTCWTSGCVHREFPGSEQVLFKERFPDWGGSLPIVVQSSGQTAGVNTAASKKQEKIDISSMHRPRIDKEEVMIDDGTGKVQIWRVEEFQKVAIDPSNYGQFYSGDSYLILYTYFFKNKDNYLIYFWQGKNSSINEKGTSALLTVELDDSLKGMAKEVRVTQNKEPKHFLSVFKGKFIVHQGKDPLSKNYKAPQSPKDPKIYHIKGTHDINTRAIESKLSIHTLNSFNTFVINNLASNNCIYVWYGKYSNTIERSFAKTISNHVAQSTPNSKVVEMEDSKESEEFFKLFPTNSLLTPQRTYPFKSIGNRVEPRLYLCTVGSGTFIVEEVNNFAQDDLIQEDVFIVDGIDQVWVWIGTDTAEIERRMSMEVALEYSQTLNSQQNRKANIPVYVTYHGKEPFIFTSLFHGWDFNKRPSNSPLSFDKEIILAKDILELYTKKYTYDDLINKRYPKGIDGSRLEEYLSDQEFLQIFKMDLQEFQKLPLWKKQTMKRELRLY
ncbi:villin [Tieghemostelium lacteum]|uniref:Villin n=1 Tax=Tieghemostelium lacteum TaxID=361077 RepID=A0A151ZRY3_TIELA|nr:villin [Tieghemostelium lacteum]|eukprot:KYQ96706.1 villin [Tieghemostelium lacteum]